MALYNFINTLPGWVAITVKELKYTTSKLQKIAFGIGFIEHALYHQITPKFANINGQFYIQVTNQLEKINLVKSFKDS